MERKYLDATENEVKKGFYKNKRNSEILVVIPVSDYWDVMSSCGRSRLDKELFKNYEPISREEVKTKSKNIKEEAGWLERNLDKLGSF